MDKRAQDIQAIKDRLGEIVSGAKKQWTGADPRIKQAIMASLGGAALGGVVAGKGRRIPGALLGGAAAGLGGYLWNPNAPEQEPRLRLGADGTWASWRPGDSDYPTSPISKDQQ